MSIEDIKKRLESGDKIRYYPFGSTVMFAPEFNQQPEYVPIAEFLKLREDGVIACGDTMAFDAFLLNAKYELYTLTQQPKSDITKGAWMTATIGSEHRVVTPKGHQTIARCGCGSEDRANAEFIVEAGTVHNETGLSPRELLRQRDDLAAMLERAIPILQKNAFENCPGHDVPEDPCKHCKLSYHAVVLLFMTTGRTIEDIEAAIATTE